LSVHSKQDEFSPPMSDKQWKKFVKGINENGVLQPLTVTEGFRIIDGKHRFLALKELGKEHVRVFVDEEIDEGDIPNYIVNNKLNKAKLKPGQRDALVIRLFYEELAQEAKVRQATSTGGANPQLIPNLDEAGCKSTTNEILAKKAGIGKSSMAYLIAVCRNRPDLTSIPIGTKVRDGKKLVTDVAQAKAGTAGGNRHIALLSQLKGGREKDTRKQNGFNFCTKWCKGQELESSTNGTIDKCRKNKRNYCKESGRRKDERSILARSLPQPNKLVLSSTRRGNRNRTSLPTDDRRREAE